MGYGGHYEISDEIRKEIIQNQEVKPSSTVPHMPGKPDPEVLEENCDEGEEDVQKVTQGKY